MTETPVLTDNESQLLRSLNTQINKIEREQNLPVLSSRPLTLGFDISSACNCDCIFCLAESGRKLSRDPGAFREPEWLDHFETLLPFINLGIFSSFEALLNPKFEEFVMRLHRYRTPFQVFTNGKALSPGLSEFMLTHGMASMHCSVHGATPAMYEDIMRGNKFSHILENLVTLKHLAARHNPAFTLVLVFCAMRRNIGELLNYVDLARRVGARCIQVNYLLVVRENTGLEREAMCFHPLIYDKVVEAAVAKAAEHRIIMHYQPLFYRYQPDKVGPCYKPWSLLNVKADGYVQVCCGGTPIVGNLFQSDFFTLWNGEAFRKFRRVVNSGNPPSACRKCTRGRENPWDVGTHLTYMHGWDQERIAARLAELGLSVPRSPFADQFGSAMHAATKLAASVTL